MLLQSKDELSQRVSCTNTGMKTKLFLRKDFNNIKNDVRILIVRDKRMKTTGTKRVAMALIAGVLGGGIAASAFYLHASRLYSQTPSDPQKAIGYIFIALYSALVGAPAFGSVFTGFMIPLVRHNKTAMLGLSVLSLLLALATALLVIFSPK
jgi:hypothetical protein